ATDDCSTNVHIVCDPPSGSFFSVGTKVVICRATDDCDNTSGCEFPVTVIKDTTPPVITCPPNMIVHTTNAAGTAVIYPPPKVTDDCDKAPSAVCNPPSGSILPPGNKIVVCTARDACGNTSQCTFVINVRLIFDGLEHTPLGTPTLEIVS